MTPFENTTPPPKDKETTAFPPEKRSETALPTRDALWLLEQIGDLIDRKDDEIKTLKAERDALLQAQKIRPVTCSYCMETICDFAEFNEKVPVHMEQCQKNPVNKFMQEYEKALKDLREAQKTVERLKDQGKRACELFDEVKRLQGKLASLQSEPRFTLDQVRIEVSNAYKFVTCCTDKSADDFSEGVIALLSPPKTPEERVTLVIETNTFTAITSVYVDGVKDVTLAHDVAVAYRLGRIAQMKEAKQ